MDSILIIKSFLIGIIWAGSFYTLASFVVPIFPMPLFLYIRKLLTNYTDEMAQHNEAKGRRWWQQAKGLFRVLVVLLWISLLALFLYLLIPILSSYILVDGLLFWGYYAVALAFPAFYMLFRGFHIFRKATNTYV